MKDFRVESFDGAWRCPCGGEAKVRIWVETEDGVGARFLCPTCAGWLAAEILNALLDNPLRISRNA